jgi:hypothetical protein
MALKRYKTNWRLWLCLSLALFAIPWFFPMMLGKTMGTPIAYSLTDPDGWGVQSQMLVVVVMAFWFGLPAVLVGWVLQAVIVSIRDRKRQSTRNAT